jgi:hypothetical protein
MYAQIRQLGDGFNREFQSAVKEPLNDLRDAVSEPVNDMKASLDEVMASAVPEDESGAVNSTEQLQRQAGVDHDDPSPEPADDDQGTPFT